MDQNPKPISKRLKKFMRGAPLNGGRPAWRLYLLLIQKYEDIYRDLTPVDLGDGTKELPPYSLRQLAVKYGVSPTLMVRLLDAVDQYSEQLATHNLDAIEKEFFGSFGDYKLLPFYRQHILPIRDPKAAPKGGGAPAPDKPPGKKRGPKPGSKRKPKDPVLNTAPEPSKPESTAPAPAPEPSVQLPAFPSAPMSRKAQALNSDIADREHS